MLTNAPTINHAATQSSDDHTRQSVRTGRLLPICQRRHSGQFHNDETGSQSGGRSRALAAVDAFHRVVEITPSDIVKRRFVAWRGAAAEIVQTTSQERIEYRFRGRMHLLAMCDQSARRDGETFLEGLPRSTLRDTSRKLVLVPAGHDYYEWQEPRALTRVTYFYLDGAGLPVPSEIGDVETSFAPRLYFEDPAIWDTALKLKRLVEGPTADDQLYVEALGAVLVHELVRLNRGNNRMEQPIRGGLAAWQQRIVTAYIEEHLAVPISLTMLGDLARLSPYYFCRAFKQSFGLPPHRYHTSRRIEHAKTLLAKPSPSVTDIGLTVGFSATSAFTAAFRRETGLTPTAYRRSLV
jgi:AraC family transcriptional regulator